MNTRILRAGLAALTAATVLLSGCGTPRSTQPSGVPASSAPADNGVTALTADEIMAKATDALAWAGSYRITATDFKTDVDETMSMDIMVSGGDFSGRITINKDAVLEILAVGGKKYIKANDAAWTTFVGAEKARTIIAVAGGRWMRAPDDDAMSGLFALGDIKEQLLKPEGLLGKGAFTQVGGTPAVIVTDSLTDMHLYVATTGKPYPMRFHSASGDGDIDLSDFGATFDAIVAPPADQVVVPPRQGS
ncbi:hypothetical protein Q0Z83_063000 [Actinoplanes sichuanensis]|uniref:Lipoprotein n=1 Tax=Actinoplanes sichuanensis TaxID=512349 RepID=A0ABW4A050_9ACTN|nr:hypothetical protein [Actinoplanes sichuanensis]BEL08109.1 hypothetical protein Q0Z83_063000 [Actinoplanes sichuanensis]